MGAEMDTDVVSELINWEEVRRQIVVESGNEDMDPDDDLALDRFFDQADASAVDLPEVSREKYDAILQARARVLAQVPESEPGEQLALIDFSLGQERYGIATKFVREVQPLAQISPVPCTPDFVMGVMNVRGEIYSVIDIRYFFGVSERSIDETSKVIFVASKGLEVGIVADSVRGVARVPLNEVCPPLKSRQTTLKEAYVQGVTRDMLIVLDLEALLSDERLIVYEEVSG